MSKNKEVLSEFYTTVTLRLPHIQSKDGSKAYRSLNKYWYGQELIPIPTPKYTNSEKHLEATFNMCKSRTIELLVQLHPDGSWTVIPQIIEC